MSAESETIKPDLVLPLKRQWFAKIWNGEKNVEYREVKPYWTRRIGAWVGDGKPHFILFQIGYAKDGPRILAQTTCIDIGKLDLTGAETWWNRYMPPNLRVKPRRIVIEWHCYSRPKSEGAARLRDATCD